MGEAYTIETPEALCDIVKRLRVTSGSRMKQKTWRFKDKTWKWYTLTDFDTMQQFGDGSAELHGGVACVQLDQHLGVLWDRRRDISPKRIQWRSGFFRQII